MNFYLANLTFSYFFVGTVLLALSITVYFNDRKNPINISFSIYSFCISWWSLFSIFIINATSENTATILNRIAILGVVFIPSTFLHFTFNFLNLSNKRNSLIKLCYLISALFLLSNLTPIFVKTTAPIYKLNYFAVPGIAYYMFLIYFAFVVVYTCKQLIDSLPNCKNYHKKQQIMYLLWGNLLGYLGGSTNFNFILGIQPYEIIPWCTYFVGIYGIFVAIAILKHHLMDINIIVKKSLIYSFLISALTVIYILLILSLEKTLQMFISYNSNYISLLSAMTLAFIFTPLKNKIQFIIDKYLFKGTAPEIYEQNVLLLQTASQVEKYKSLSTLSSGVAHEIKNPLQAIKTFTEYLPNKLEDKEFLLNFSRIVGVEVSRINDLVLQLMEYSKPSPPKLEPVNIHKLIDDSLNFLNSRMNKYNINLNKEYEADADLIIKVDKNQIRQALLNILLNAMDSMETGGTLTVKTEVNSGKQKLIIHIIDTGIGIPKDQLNRIFEPFYSQKSTGTGLGLPIVRRTIENHRGTISVKSEANQGTTIKISLPF